MNRGSLGVRELHMALQRVLNPVRTGEPAVERYGWRFKNGDKVIQTENNHDNEPMIEVDPVVEDSARHSRPVEPNLNEPYFAQPNGSEKGSVCHVEHRGGTTSTL